MMELRINKDFKIITDSKQYILQKRSVQGAEAKNPGTEVWSNVGYYQSFEGVVKESIHHGIRTCDLEDIQDIADYIDQFMLGFTGKVFTLNGKNYRMELVNDSLE